MCSPELCVHSREPAFFWEWLIISDSELGVKSSSLKRHWRFLQGAGPFPALCWCHGFLPGFPSCWWLWINLAVFSGPYRAEMWHLCALLGLHYHCPLHWGDDVVRALPAQLFSVLCCLVLSQNTQSVFCLVFSLSVSFAIDIMITLIFFHWALLCVLLQEVLTTSLHFEVFEGFYLLADKRDTVSGKSRHGLGHTACPRCLLTWPGKCFTKKG